MFAVLKPVARFRPLFEKIKLSAHPARRRQNKRYLALRRRFYHDYWQEAAEKIGAECQEYGYGYQRIRRNGKFTFVRLSEVMLDDHLTYMMAGNKPLIHRLLLEHGYPAPRFVEFSLNDMEEAIRFLSEMNEPVVIKPAAGTGGGRGVHTHITSLPQLYRASKRASAWGTSLLMEEFVVGDSYRLLYLDGEFLDAIRRDPPSVVGDGKSSIRTLMLREDKSRREGTPITALSPLTIDLEAVTSLKKQGLNPRSRPAHGQSIVVKDAVNQNSSKDNHVVTNLVHPSVVELGKEILALFRIKLGGIDIITTDITKPLEQSGGVINEVNTTPGLHHHALVAEKRELTRIPEAILNYLLDNH